MIVDSNPHEVDNRMWRLEKDCSSERFLSMQQYLLLILKFILNQSKNEIEVFLKALLHIPFLGGRGCK